MQKTATQAGYAVHYSKSSSGFQFVTVRKVDGYDYAEFWLDEGYMSGSVNNSLGFLDLPLSVVALIRFWFGTISIYEYQEALNNV